MHACSHVAPEYTNGWTLDECQSKYLGPSNNPFKPLHVELPNLKPKDTLTTWSGDISIITLTVAVTVLFFTVQVCPLPSGQVCMWVVNYQGAAKLLR